jgi:hypothetical protein
MISDRQIRAIVDHITRHLGEPETVLHEMVPQDLHIDVHVVPPTSRGNWYWLVTSGMSGRPMATPRELRGRQYAELMLCLPPDWRISEPVNEVNRHTWPILSLKILARFPHQYGTWLGPFHTVPNGDPPEPFAAGTEFCCYLVREPATTPPEFAALRAGKKTIHFLGVVPIYRDEMEFALGEGQEALAARLDAAGVTELLDVGRPSVFGTRP